MQNKELALAFRGGDTAENEPSKAVAPKPPKQNLFTIYEGISKPVDYLYTIYWYSTQRLHGMETSFDSSNKALHAEHASLGQGERAVTNMLFSAKSTEQRPKMTVTSGLYPK